MKLRKLIPHLAYGLFLGGAVLLAVSAVHAQAPQPWKLVAGTGQAPKDYALSDPFSECEVKAVYGWNDGEWLTWFKYYDPLATEFLLDKFTMEPSRGYWVWCN